MKHSTKHKIKILVFAVLTAAAAAMIFYMSSKNGSQSQNMSDSLIDGAIGQAVEALPKLTSNGIVDDIRKYGHIAEYFLLGFFSMLLAFECWRHSERPYVVAVDPESSRSIYGGQGGYRKRPGSVELSSRVLTGFAIASSFIFCFLYACSDEWHQTFVPGRSGQMSDVLKYDLPGFIFGMAIAIVIWAIIRLARRKKDSFVDLTR